MPRQKNNGAAGMEWVRGKGKKKRTVYTEKQALNLTDRMSKKTATLLQNAGQTRFRNDLTHGDSTLNNEWEDFGIDEMDIDAATDWSQLGEITPAEAVNQLIKRLRPRRSNKQRRQNAATNWILTEDRLVGALFGDQSSEQRVPYECKASQAVLPSQNSRPRRFISFESYQVREMTLCSCGCTLMELAKEGYFPASPLVPETFFSIHLLRTLVEMTNAGSISRTAWGDGLRRALIHKLGVQIPPFTRLLRDAYHHFLATLTKFETKIDTDIQFYSERPHIDGRREGLRNACPACFNFDQSEETIDIDRAIHITVDGNMQHTRYLKGEIGDEYEELPLRNIINFGVRDYPRADGSGGDTNSFSCSNNFKATKEWKEGPVNSSTNKAVDETGLMGMCCIHGSFLRALNFYQSGERRAHAAALINSIFQDTFVGVQVQKLRLCYDVACKFDKAVADGLFGENSIKVDSKINRFHIFGHKYACHILYNLLRTKGWGLMNGEEIERLWASLRHLIRAGRVCSGPRRAQRIDAAITHLARYVRESMGRNLARRIKNTLEVQNKHEKVLAELLETKLPLNGRIITREYLAEQAERQQSYYTLHPQVDPSDRVTLKARKAQEKVITIVINTSVELAEVQRCTRSLRNAETFMRAINLRSKKLGKAVNRYNREIQKLIPPRGRQLDVKILRAEGIQYDELWDLDRSYIVDDWAIYPQVRIGIDSMFRLERASEEHLRCSLHLRRHLKWVIDTAGDIMGYIENNGNELTTDQTQELKSMLVHRQIVGRDLLTAKGLNHDDNDKQALMLILRRISSYLPRDGIYMNDAAIGNDDDPDELEENVGDEDYETENEEDLLDGLEKLQVDVDESGSDSGEDEDEN